MERRKTTEVDLAKGLNMRNSPLRHPLAVLRTTLGLTQREMADLVQRARVTVQAVELGKLPLSEGLAARIAEETGVDVGWLLDGDPAKPALKADGDPYTRADYAGHRASREAASVPAGSGTDHELVLAFQWMLADTAGLPGAELVRWKVRRMLDSLSAEITAPK